MGKYATLWDQKQNGLFNGVFALTSYASVHPSPLPMLLY